MNTQAIVDILNSSNIEYTVDNNPSPEKVTRIQRALDRKKALMELAVVAYKQVMRIS